MQLYTVWNVNKIGVNEKCLMNQNGDYIGQKTGYVYMKEEHYHSKQIKGKIIGVDEVNLTGMVHLYSNNVQTENNKLMKSKYIGCYVTLEMAHYCDKLMIYRCLELDDYFSENEVEIFN